MSSKPKYKTRKFTKEFLQDALDGSEKEITTISDEVCGHSRWSVEYKWIFKFEGKFYRTYYSVGATESQDEIPFQYDPEEIEVVEVKPIEKMVIVYVEVREEPGTSEKPEVLEKEGTKS